MVLNQSEKKGVSKKKQNPDLASRNAHRISVLKYSNDLSFMSNLVHQTATNSLL